MIGPPTWVYSATVGDSTAGTSIFPRRRSRARRGALRQEFRGEYLNLGGTRGVLNLEFLVDLELDMRFGPPMVIGPLFSTTIFI
jgi:hypothetical protein